MGRMGYGPSVAQSMDLNTETESENNEQARNPKAGRGFLVFRPKQGLRGVRNSLVSYLRL